jgi:hypothetical protein
MIGRAIAWFLVPVFAERRNDLVSFKVTPSEIIRVLNEASQRRL